MASSQSRLPLGALLTVVGLAGASTMTVELSAVRLLAPWFGASVGVWTNVIGVILFALSLGYLLGARLSRRASPLRWMAIVLALAALVTAWLPALARPVASYFLPAGLALDEAAGLLVWGSLAASLVLFVPAAAMLGCLGPLAVEALQLASGRHAGDAGGRVLAASTIGSLAGTFGTTHAFLPRLGVSATFHLAGAVLAACSIVFALTSRCRQGGEPPRAGLALLILPWLATLAGMGLAQQVRPAPLPGDRLLQELSSPYQALRVVERGLGTERRRLLQANESLDSFQSIWQPEPGLLGDGAYYDLFSLPAHWARAERPELERWRVLILGLGAGTTVRVLDGASPAGMRVETLGIEIDPGVVELGRAHFELREGEAQRVLLGDARALLAGLDQDFDQIVVDCYANNMEIPAHLATVEFYRELLSKLKPRGWLSINAAGFGLRDPVVRAVAASAAAAIAGEARERPGGQPSTRAERALLGLRVPFSRNCIFFARRGAEAPEPGGGDWHFESEVHRELLGRLELPGAWAWIAAGEDPAPTDDRCAIELLQLESVLAGRRQWYVSE